MRKAALKAGLATVALAAAMPAAAAVTITGSVTDISVNSRDPGLVINASPIAFPTFTLGRIGQFVEFPVLTIGTSEASVDFPDDFLPRPISVGFTFTSPEVLSSSRATGNTFGFISSGACSAAVGGCGQAVFTSPALVNFSEGGQFSISLSRATFATPGSTEVIGRFTLLSAVPEPSTWAMMLLGFGAIGAAMRSPKRRRTTVSYA